MDQWFYRKQKQRRNRKMTEDLQEQLAAVNEQKDKADKLVLQLTANNTLQTEKIDKLEKDLQRLSITGAQLVKAQNLRNSDPTKTKAELAEAVGVDHQVLASVLGGVDTILNEATKGTYTQAQFDTLKQQNSDLQKQNDEISQKHDDVEAQLIEAQKEKAVVE